MPKYSIIIPVLNEKELLPGILNQLSNKELRSKFDYEIIVSDGGSTDGSIEIALSNADIVKVHSNKRPQNIAGGRNLGAKYASGKVLIFINGDVLLSESENFLSYVDDKFYNSNYLAMTCFVKIFPEERRLRDSLFHIGYNNYFRFLNNAGVGMGRGECQIVKKDVFEKLNGYNESLAAGEDFDLFKRIRKLGKTLFTNEICVYESPRRFRKLGYFNVTWSWIKNGFSVALKNKSISKKWEQVR